MGLSGTIWDYMGLSGTIWEYLGISQTGVPVEAREIKVIAILKQIVYRQTLASYRGARAPKKQNKKCSICHETNSV